MLDSLLACFPNEEGPQSETHPKTAAEIRTRLRTVEVSIQSTGEQLERMRTRRSTTTGVIGTLKLAGQIGGLEQILRAQEEQRGAIAQQLRVAEDEENLAGGRAMLAAQIDDAEVKLRAFESAIVNARAAEAALFDALFNERSGLASCPRRLAMHEDLRKEAVKTRHRLSAVAQQAARKVGYGINPDFETDGLPNLGVRESDVHMRQAEAAIHARQLTRVSNALVGC